MTSGVYPRETSAWTGNGGVRHAHTEPKLAYEQVLEAREMRDKGCLIKTIAFKFGVGRALIWRVLSGTGAYKGY